MKKIIFAMGIVLLMIICCSCNKTDVGDATEKTDDSIVLPVENDLEEENIHQISLVSGKAADWTQTLLETQELTVDLNMDNQDDVIYLTYEEKEGSQYISRFEVKFAGVSEAFIIEDYDASLEKLEVFDFNQDKIDELIIIFDTHGSGGQGTHDIFVLSIENNSLRIYNVNPNIEGLVDLEDSWSIDEPYVMQKVLYKGNEEMLIRQYVWGEQGHSDHVGDLISIVSLNKETNDIMPGESWLESAK